MSGPANDGAVPSYWSDLGLPGLADVHVHFMPHNVLAKVWAYFDAAGPLIGREWPIHYRGSDEERLSELRALGVRGFPSLVYAHKPGMSAWLNEWSLAFADTVPEVIPTATFFAEPSALAYVKDALAGGARMWKVHVQVGAWDPRSPDLDEVWGLLSELGTPIIAHVGSGPVPGPFTGPGPIAEVLARHPALPLVVAHMGMPDLNEFLALADRYDNVRLDTTMAFVDFFEPMAVDASLVKDLGLRGKVLWGSDFPNIPYAYAHGIEALARLDLGDDWMRQVLWHAPAALMGLT